MIEFGPILEARRGIGSRSDSGSGNGSIESESMEPWTILHHTSGREMIEETLQRGDTINSQIGNYGWLILARIEGYL